MPASARIAILFIAGGALRLVFAIRRQPNHHPIVTGRGNFLRQFICDRSEGHSFSPVFSSDAGTLIA